VTTGHRLPFISLQAACLAVGRLLARDLPEQANLLQYDASSVHKP